MEELKAGKEYKCRMVQTPPFGIFKQTINIYPEDKSKGNTTIKVQHDLMINTYCEYHMDSEQLTILNCTLIIEGWIVDNQLADRVVIK